MRGSVLTMALALTLALVGCGTPKCKNGTALVTATFDAAARAADALAVVVELDGNAQAPAPLPGPRGRDSGTLQVEFPKGYHAGSTLKVTITARLGGQDVAQGSAVTTLAAGCSTLPLAVVGLGGDGGELPDLASPDMTMLPTPVVTAKPDLVGFATTLDGSGSSDPLGETLTFQWAIEQAPAGSKITSSALTSATAAKASFEPDRGGVYKISLTVTTADSRAATKVVDVTVPTAPILYTKATTTATTYDIGTWVIASDGTGDHSVACDIAADGGVSPSTASDVQFFGHAYEPPTGSGTPRFAFLGVDSAMTMAHLLVATPQNNCASSPPPVVDNNVFADHFPLSARFSPDGTRIVYVDMPQDTTKATYRLVTVSADGTGPKHVIRSDGTFPTTPAIWLDNQTVAWVEWDDSTYSPFTIYKAPDQNAAGQPGAPTRAAVLQCNHTTNPTHLDGISQFEMTSFGLIVAGNVDPRCTALCNPPYAAVSVYKLAAGDCSVQATGAKTLAAEPRGGVSWDFALSPDGLNILFSSTHGEPIPDGGLPVPQSDIFLVAADGSGQPQKIAGDPLYDDISPRYIAGGRQFIWSRVPRGLDMGAAAAPTIMIANADGTHVRALNPQLGAGETLISAQVGANRGFECSWVPGGATAPTSGLLVCAALLLVVGYLTWRSRGRT